MKKSIPAVLFAGGKSSRMQTDKALLPFGGYETLAEFQHSKLTALFEAVYLSAKTDKFPFPCKVIQDKEPLSAPLVGIIALFEALGSNAVFILSVDAPFVSTEQIEMLVAAANPAYDAIIAQSPSGIQPLCGIYRRSILPLAYKHLAEKNYALHTLLRAANTHFVTFDDDAPFANLNHPHEYEEALRRF
jgi:molybdopterin-guanine dinucleotide biosynthesis protein A